MNSENWHFNGANSSASTTPSRPPPITSASSSRLSQPQSSQQQQPSEDPVLKASQDKLAKYQTDYGQVGKKTEDVSGSPTQGVSIGSAGRFGKTSLYGMIPDTYDPSTPTHPRSHAASLRPSQSTPLASSVSRSRLPIPSFSSPEAPRPRTTTQQSESSAGTGEEDDAPMGGRGFGDVWAGRGGQSELSASGSGQNISPPQPVPSPQPQPIPSVSPILRIVGPPPASLPNLQGALSQMGQLDYFRLGPPDSNWCEARFRDPVVGMRTLRKSGSNLGGYTCGVFEVKGGEGVEQDNGPRSSTGGVGGGSRPEEGRAIQATTSTSSLIPGAKVVIPTHPSSPFRPSTPAKKVGGAPGSVDRDFGLGIGAAQQQESSGGWLKWAGEWMFGK